MSASPQMAARIMTAASNTECTGLRESAILGGIVRSLLDTGHFKPKFVQHCSDQVLAYFGWDIAKVEPTTYLGRPTEAEIRHVASKFMNNYAPGAA